MNIPNGVAIEKVVANLCDIVKFGRDYKSIPEDKRISMDIVRSAVQETFPEKKSDNDFWVSINTIPDLHIHFSSPTELDAESFDAIFGIGMAGKAISDAISDTIATEVFETPCVEMWKD